MGYINSRKSRAEGGSSMPAGQFYSEYKDRLTLLERIEDLESFAVPNLRAEYQRQAILVQMGRGNPKRAKALADDLEEAEQAMLSLKTRLNSIQDCN